MRKIVLIDFSLDGHHLSFIRSFSKVLLDQGHKVFCVVPGSDKVVSWIETNVPDRASNFKGYIYHYMPRQVTGGRFGEILQVLERWKYERNLVRDIERNNGERIDLVFYAWLDNQIAPFVPPFILDYIFPYKWTGLYFHPYHLRLESNTLERRATWRDMDSIFLARNCIGVTVHDSGIRQKFSQRIGKPVIHFPETADDSAPDYSYPLYKAIKEKARGRLVVGMIGCEKHKGTLTLMRMAKNCDPDRYFFAFLGILPEATYSTDEWVEVQNFVQEGPENCFFHFKSIPEGNTYNAVFCAFDIPFLVYDNFISSSNRLTKAAIFEKLVLASDNYCVGDDVKNYNLGVAVPPKDTEAGLAGLEKLRQNITGSSYPLEEWKAYRDLNSYEKLYERFKEVVALLNSHKN